MPGKEEFTQAAMAYLAAKAFIMIGSGIYTSCADCGAYSVARHAIHLVLFTHFIYAGMRITSSIIAVACVVRGIAYTTNSILGKSYLMSLPLTGSEIELLGADGSGRYFMFINALLLFSVAAMIARAVKARGFSRSRRDVAVRTDSGVETHNGEAEVAIR